MKAREYVEITYASGSPPVQSVAALQSCIAEVLLERGPLTCSHLIEETGSGESTVRESLQRMRARGFVVYSEVKVPGEGRSPRLWVADREALAPYIKAAPTRVLARHGAA